MIRISVIFATSICLCMLACSKNEAEKPEVAPVSAKKAAPAVKPAPTPTPIEKPAPAGEAAPPAKAAPGTGTGLEGQWTLDLEGFKASAEFKALEPQMKEMALKMFSSMKMKLTIDAKSIRTEGELMGRKQDKTTQYKVIKKEGNTYSLDIAYGDGKPNKTQLMEVTGNSLIIRDGKLMVVLKRI